MGYIFFNISGVEQHIDLVTETTIGRGTSNRFRIPDASVSKYHALIRMDSQRQCILQDLKSTNGTFVNNQRIEDRHVLSNGDEIRFGNFGCWYGQSKKTGVETSPPLPMPAEEECFLHTLTIPPSTDRFLPEKEIPDEKTLRADYEKLRLTYELQRDMQLKKDFKIILDHILERIAAFLYYDKGAILIADPDGEMHIQSVNTKTDVSAFTVSKTLVHHVSQKKAGVISVNTPADERFNIADSIILQGIQSTIAAPLLSADDLFGILILCSITPDKTFTVKDLGLITGIARQAGQIIANSLLHDEIRLSFEASIRTLSATVDERHPMTAGHSERVAEYALFVGEEMGLTENELENLKFAALLHDIGKIGIQDSILLKNGALTPEERETMSLHPEKTKKILENFHFPRTLKRVPEYASHHHEKVNGQGYPNALEGSQLPVISKIIAVADVFDALTEKRDYPKYLNPINTGPHMDYEPLPISDAISVIQNSAGTHLDPTVVEGFMRCLPKLLTRFKSIHFQSKYVDDALKLLAR